MYQLLLVVHVAAGTLALLSSLGAVIAPKGGRAHRWAGRAFAAGMAVIFVTALPMTALRPNLFLFLVAIFNGYLTLTGWLLAKNRTGIPTRLEWAVAAVMATAAVAMVGRGVFMLASGASMGVVLLVFAAIGGGLALRDLARLRARRYRGPERIAAHLARMLGGMTGAITAFVVTNVRVEPAFLPWIVPAIVLTPVIVYWSRRVRIGTVVHAARAGATRSA